MTGARMERGPFVPVWPDGRPVDPERVAVLCSGDWRRRSPGVRQVAQHVIHVVPERPEWADVTNHERSSA